MVHSPRMPTVTVSRSDLWPVGTTVGIYAGGAHNPGGAPLGAAITTGTVDAAGALSVTNAGLLSLTRYTAAAQIGSEWRYCRVRSTLDVTDKGTATGTVDTTSGSTTLANVT